MTLETLISYLFKFHYVINRFLYLRCSCGEGGRVVDPDTRDPRFETIHRQFYLHSIVKNKLYRKDKNEVKRGSEGYFLSNVF